MLQTARTAGAAALLWIYWAKLMRDLHTCVSSALCGAPFYTAETHAKKNPFFMGWLLQQHCDCSGADWVTLATPEQERVKENEERKGNTICKRILQPVAPAAAACPGWSESLGRDRGLCNRGESSARSFLLPHPRAQAWPLRRRERSSRGTLWVMALMTGEFLAGCSVLSTAPALRKEPCSAECWILISHLPSK